MTAGAPAEGVTAVTSGDRLDTLDGMRGFAAMLVVIYHFFARWAEPIHEQTFYPHGNLLQYAPAMAHFGRIGVLLFFLVSGFVIMMTLERSRSVLDFVGKRVARLWPTMIVCASLSTIVINGSGIADYYPGMDWWTVTPKEYVASVFFVPPDLAASMLGMDPRNLQWVEGVYWTLWHEVRFYALITVVFLLSPRAWFLWAWVGVQAVSTSVEVAEAVTGEYLVAGLTADLVFQPRMLAWFSLGICGYMLWTQRRSLAVPVIAALAVAAILANEIVTFEAGRLALSETVGRYTVIYTAVAVPFILFLVRSPILGFMRWRVLLTIGVASYPLYLFHELPGMTGMMIGAELGLPPLFVALSSIVVLVCVAILIHYLVEIPAKSAIMRIWRRAFGSLDHRVSWLRF